MNYAIHRTNHYPSFLPSFSFSFFPRLRGVGFCSEMLRATGRIQEKKRGGSFLSSLFLKANDFFLLSSLVTTEQSKATTIRMIHPAKLAGLLNTAGHWGRQHFTCASWPTLHKWPRWPGHCWKFILRWRWINTKVKNFMVRKWNYTWAGEYKDAIFVITPGLSYFS